MHPQTRHWPLRPSLLQAAHISISSLKCLLGCRLSHLHSPVDLGLPSLSQSLTGLESNTFVKTAFAKGATELYQTVGSKRQERPQSKGESNLPVSATSIILASVSISGWVCRLSWREIPRGSVILPTIHVGISGSGRGDVFPSVRLIITPHASRGAVLVNGRRSSRWRAITSTVIIVLAPWASITIATIGSSITARTIAANTTATSGRTTSIMMVVVPRSPVMTSATSTARRARTTASMVWNIRLRLYHRNSLHVRGRSCGVRAKKALLGNDLHQPHIERDCP